MCIVWYSIHTVRVWRAPWRISAPAGVGGERVPGGSVGAPARPRLGFCACDLWGSYCVPLSDHSDVTLEPLSKQIFFPEPPRGCRDRARNASASWERSLPSAEDPGERDGMDRPGYPARGAPGDREQGGACNLLGARLYTIASTQIAMECSTAAHTHTQHAHHGKFICIQSHAQSQANLDRLKRILSITTRLGTQSAHAHLTGTPLSRRTNLEIWGFDPSRFSRLRCEFPPLLMERSPRVSRPRDALHVKSYCVKSEPHKLGHGTTGHRLFSEEIPTFQHCALSS